MSKLTNKDWLKLETTIREIIKEHSGEMTDENHPIFQLDESQFCLDDKAAALQAVNFLQHFDTKGV